MARALQLDPDGAQLFPAAFTVAGIARLEQRLDLAPMDRPGTRLEPLPGLADAIRPATDIATAFLGPGTKPVRATLFDKSPARNWALGWHQDRTIAVRRRIDTPGFTDWTVKAGIAHVVPPFDLLARMLTARIHIDPVGAENAPLLIAPSSHKLGRALEAQIEALGPSLDAAACLAARGDLWLYATPVLHASARAARPSRRRVLQILYCAENLPDGLEWLGV